MALSSAINDVMKGLNKDYEVIFVDDGSTDSSLEVLKKIKKLFPDVVRILCIEKNSGKTAALDAAFKSTCGETIITMDADMQNDPKDIPLLLEKIKNYDVVCGWRQHRKDPLSKKISSKIANYVRNCLSNEEIRDIGCSLKAFRREHLLKIKLYAGMHRFFPTLLKMEGCEVVEVPVRHHPRLSGTSKYNIKNRIFKSFFDLLAVRWMKKNRLNYQVKEI